MRSIAGPLTQVGPEARALVAAVEVAASPAGAYKRDAEVRLARALGEMNRGDLIALRAGLETLDTEIDRLI